MMKAVKISSAKHVHFDMPQQENKEENPMTINVRSAKIQPVTEICTTEIIKKELVKIQKQYSVICTYYKYLQWREKLTNLFWVSIKAV